MDSQTVANPAAPASLVANDFVTFGTAATLTAATATALTGGTNAAVNAAKHTAALNAFEVESFNVIGYPGTNTDVKALYGAFVKRLRDDEGRKIVGVLYDYDGRQYGPDQRQERRYPGQRNHIDRRQCRRLGGWRFCRVRK